MKSGTWKPYVFFVLLTEAVGALAGILSRDGIEAYSAMRKSVLTPPGAVFIIVWVILYALMGIGAARIWLSPVSQCRTKSLDLFKLQLAVNFMWSLLFFNLQALGFSLVWLILLWVLILLMILSYKKVDSLAAKLQLPYILWVTFAAYLNGAAWFLNR